VKKVKRYRIWPRALERFIRDVLIKAGVGERDAINVARCLAAADLRGIDSHGVIRLPVYLQRLEKGFIETRTRLEVVAESPSTALLDANNGWGATAGAEAMKMAVAKARETGVGVVAVRNSNHFGIAAHYALMAVRDDMIGLALTNSSPSMAPWGGNAKLLGTNPICIAVPTGGKWPLVYDGATSTVARGRLVVARERKQAIPPDWALDPKGQPTTDPEVGLLGTLMPLGGYKGYGLALMVDVLCGVLTGAAFGPEVGQLSRPDRPQEVGHFFAAVDISRFLPVEEFKHRVDQLAREMKEAPRRAGVAEIFLPGEIEFRQQEVRERDGIPIDIPVWKKMEEIAWSYGVEIEGWWKEK